MSQVTKRALEESLKRMLLKKPLDKITISDITEDCGINRMTFYYHFKDIYDLVEWACEEDAARALDGKKTCDTWQQGFLQIFEAVTENRPFILNVYHSVNREQVERYLYRLTYGLIIGVVEEKARGLNVSEADKHFIADFYKYGFVGLMLDWIRSDMKEEPAAIVERLDTLIRGDTDLALSRFTAQAAPQHSTPRPPADRQTD
jgi:probable dihydroxyacetone kinase regulator